MMAQGIDLPPLLGLGAPLVDAEVEAQAAEPAATDGPSGPQIDMPDILVPHESDPAATARYERRSVELLARARDAKQKRKLSSDVADAMEQAAKATRCLDLVAKVLPVAGALLGKSRSHSHLAKTFGPMDVVALAFAAHWPQHTKNSPGMNKKRLGLVAHNIVVDRQAAGLRNMLENVSQHREVIHQNPDLAENVFMVTTHSHEWDETNARLKALVKQKGKATKAITKAPTTMHALVQRGTLTFFLNDFGETPRAATTTEEWIVAPHQVQGTKVADIHPAVMAGVPVECRVDISSSRTALSKSSDVHIYLPMGDRASSNLLLMKWMCCIWEEEVRLQFEDQPPYLICPCTCQVHSHHRGKLQIKTLKQHIARHYGVTSIMKLHSVQLRAHQNLERLVYRQSPRLCIDPPPLGNQRLHTMLDIIFGFDKPFHVTPAGQLSKHIRDLYSLLELLNGEGMSHCCGKHARKRCCTSDDDFHEKLFCRVTSVLMGRSDPRVCESRWTNLLPSMKKSILRKILGNWGVASLSGVGNTDGGIASELSQDVDREAFEASMTEASSIRINRVLKYYADPTTWQELVVLVCVLEASDEMLYHMLGGQDRLHPPGKVMDLVKREANIVGVALQNMQRLLEQWSTDDECRRPWCLLDAVQAPLHEQKFKSWARAQILRAASVWSRRYEQKFSSYPFSLVKLVSDEWGDASRQSFISELRAGRRCCLDPFTCGLLLLYPSRDALQSKKCKQVVEAFLKTHRLSSDWSERQNAEVTASHPVRAPGRNFEVFARASVVKQARVVHMTGGGEDPLVPKALTGSAEVERVPALGIYQHLPPPVVSGQPQDARAGSSVDHPAARLQGDGSPEVGHGALASRDCIPGGSLFDKVFVKLNPLVKEDEEASEVPFDLVPIDAPPAKKRGLSRYMLYKNTELSNAKKLLGGRSMTNDEQQYATNDIKDRWHAICSLPLREQLYEEWRLSPTSPSATSTKKPVKTAWMGGCRACPISASDIVGHHQSHGWPKDEEIYQASKYSPAPATTIDWDRCKPYNLFGCSQSGKACCLNKFAEDPKFQLIHDGLCNYLETLPKSLSESGEVIVMIEGSLKRPPGALSRRLDQITNTIWNPR